MIMSIETGTLRKYHHKIPKIRAQHQPLKSIDFRSNNSCDRGDTTISVRGPTCVTLPTSELTS